MSSNHYPDTVNPSLVLATARMENFWQVAVPMLPLEFGKKLIISQINNQHSLKSTIYLTIIKINKAYLIPPF